MMCQSDDEGAGLPTDLQGHTLFHILVVVHDAVSNG